MPISADFPFQEYLPFWDALPRELQTELRAAAQLRHAHTDQVIHTGGRCDGFFIIVSGRLRCRTAAESGRSITLFRLFAHDVCLFSASCILKSISFTVTIEAECDTDYLRIPPAVYRRVSAASAQAAQFTNEILASRFSDVMWLMDQLLNGFSYRRGAPVRQRYAAHHARKNCAAFGKRARSRYARTQLPRARRHDHAFPRRHCDCRQRAAVRARRRRHSVTLSQTAALPFAIFVP